MENVITIATLRKEKRDNMYQPTLIGSIVDDLQARGITRDELAARLGVQPPSISHLKSGRGSLDDSKLSILAALHGGYTASEIKAVKYLEWLEREKNLSVSDLQDAQVVRSRKSSVKSAA